MKQFLAAVILVWAQALPAAGPKAGLNPTLTPSPLFAAAASKPIVLLDAGHGGEDAGVRAGELKESALTLELAKAAGALLAAQGVDVRYTRSDDSFISVSARVLTANTVPVQAFVSLHLNHSFNPEAQGPRVFAPKERALSGAALHWENASAGQAVLSRELGAAVATSLGIRGAKPVQNLRLAQFRGLAVPGVLVEIEMASNPSALMSSVVDAGHWEALARSLAQGITTYLLKQEARHAP